MKFLTRVLIGFSWITVISAYSQKNIKLSYPDGNIQYASRVKDKTPVYSASKDKLIIENPGLSLSFLETGLFKNNLKILQPVFREAVEPYELIVGKAKSLKHFFKEVIIPLEETKTPSGR